MENKPIVAFDLETTGLDKTKDQIIQIACVKFDPETYEIIDQYDSYVQPQGNYSISIQAYFKHKIKPDFLKDKPYFYEIAPDIVSFFNECDVLTFNGNSFDISFLVEELAKCGLSIDFLSKKCYDAFVEEQKRHANRLESTYERYVGKSMEENGLSSHNAYSDVIATVEVFKHQQQIESYDPPKMYGEDNFIVDKIFNDELVPCFGVGKYKDLSVDFVINLDKNYVIWACSDKASFSKNTKKFLKECLDKHK